MPVKMKIDHCIDSCFDCPFFDEDDCGNKACRLAERMDLEVDFLNWEDNPDSQTVHNACPLRHHTVTFELEV